MAKPLRPTWTLSLPPSAVETALLTGDQTLIAEPMRCRADEELEGSEAIFVSAQPGRIDVWRPPVGGIHPDVLRLRIRADDGGCRIETRWRSHPYTLRGAWSIPLLLAVIGVPLHIVGTHLLAVDPWLWWGGWAAIIVIVHRFVHEVHEQGRTHVLQVVESRLAPYLRTA